MTLAAVIIVSVGACVYCYALGREAERHAILGDREDLRD